MAAKGSPLVPAGITGNSPSRAYKPTQTGQQQANDNIQQRKTKVTILFGWGGDDEDLASAPISSLFWQFVQRWNLRVMAREAAL